MQRKGTPLAFQEGLQVLLLADLLLSSSILFSGLDSLVLLDWLQASAVQSTASADVKLWRARTRSTYVDEDPDSRRQGPSLGRQVPGLGPRWRRPDGQARVAASDSSSGPKDGDALLPQPGECGLLIHWRRPSQLQDSGDWKIGEPNREPWGRLRESPPPPLKNPITRHPGEYLLRVLGVWMACFWGKSHTQFRWPWMSRECSAKPPSFWNLTQMVVSLVVIQSIRDLFGDGEWKRDPFLKGCWLATWPTSRIARSMVIWT